jgi:hypothetical protein
MKNVPDPTQHQGGERIVNYGFVKDGQQLLGNDGRHGMQAQTRAAGEYDPFYSPRLAFILGFQRWRATIKFVMAKT